MTTGVRTAGSRRVAFGCLVIAAMWAGAVSAAAGEKALAQEILAATGVRGGLVVHVGCGDGKLTAALRASESYLVQGLDADAASVEKARAHIKSLGLYGKVTADTLRGGRLPYADNLVNLVVAEGLGKVPMAEVMRVLCPNGVAYVKSNGKWAKTVKPRPENIDEWTHALHAPDNNAVADDAVVGPPRHMQWVGGPKWARSHDHLSSTSVVVASGGRLFYIADEGPAAAVALPAEWLLTARDAFSGVVLWKRPIGPWEWHLRGFRSGPPEIQRTLVAVNDTVYVTLGYGKPLTALDAATGKTLKTYEGTKGTIEILCCDGVLYLVAGDRPTKKEAEASAAAWRRGVTPRAHSKRLLAIKADTGALLWQKSGADTAEVMPTTLAVAGGRAVFQNTDEVVCLDAKSGREHWRAPRPVGRSRPGWSTPTLVVHGDVVLSADRAATATAAKDAGDTMPHGVPRVQWVPSSAGGIAPVGDLIAFSARTGKELWRCKCRESYNSPVDVLVADGLVWTGVLVRATEPGITQGRDPLTGEVKRTRPPDKQFFSVGMNHHRCHRNKATNRYLVLGRAGIELIDLATGKGSANHWVRGACQYGVVPCNGLLYAPPHSCACYIEAKLNGFNALAPARRFQVPGSGLRDGQGKRLLKGPAYGSDPEPETRNPEPDAWPTFRHDVARSGYTKTQVPAALTRVWQAKLEGRLSALAIADGKVFVAAIDTHTVHALDAKDGKPVWSYTAGGRVDSPPTIHNGLAIFGSADGWVYCLRASDGELAWRFRAAPSERRVVSYGQLESAWPVHGSVLVEGDAVYCAAGRSSFLDGGLRLYRLDANTGKMLSETRISGLDPKTGEEIQTGVRGTGMPGTLPDVLSSDGTSVFMRHTRFDRSSFRQQQPDVPHLFSSVGFLDGMWWHRTYWMLGTRMGSGYGGWPTVGNRVPAGRLLVLDESSVYGFGRHRYANHGSHVGVDATTIFHFRPSRDVGTTSTHYRLFAVSKAAARSRRQAPERLGASCIGVANSKSLNPAGTPLSVEAWVKARKADGAIVARGAIGHGYALFLRGGKPGFAVRVASKPYEVSAKEKAVGKWVHLAGVLTADKKLQVYVNGKLSGTASAPGFITTDPTQAMEIGADEGIAVGNYTSPFSFAGTIDEVRVYFRALSASEVEQHCLKPPQAADPALVLYYSFDKGDATDGSGKKNHGTVEGAKPTEGKLGKAMAFTGGRSSAVVPESNAHWTQQVPLAVRAMVLADKTLFVAGPLGDVDRPLDALAGNKGSVLWAVSAADGKKLAEHKLPASPVFDGMAAAGGRLYLSAADGTVSCMGSRR